MRRFNIIVRGKVQGVFFRASAKEIADRLGIKGFVRNERDGSVYIEAEGDDDQLKKFITWCHQGPNRAEVVEVKTIEMPLNNFSVFEINS